MDAKRVKMARFLISNNEDVADLFPSVSPEDAGNVLDIETEMDFSYPVPSVYTYVALISSATEITSEGVRVALESWNNDDTVGWYEDDGGNQHKINVLRYQLLVTSDIKNIGVNRSSLDVSGLQLVIQNKEDTTAQPIIHTVSYTDYASSMDHAKTPTDLISGYGVEERINYHQNHVPVLSASRTIGTAFGGVVLIQFSHTVDPVEFYGFMKKDVGDDSGVCVYDVRTNDENIFVGYMKDDTESEFNLLADYGSISIVGSCRLEFWNEDENEPEPEPTP